jgi:adenylosuccinate synthase
LLTVGQGSGPFPTELHDEMGEKLQSVGREFGVTTGRKRRCGWLDLVLVQYSHEVNHYTAINLTKLDILDSFEEIKVAVRYSYDGQALESFPADLHILTDDEKFKIEYETLPGWNTSTVGAKTYEDLPENARRYVDFIEQYLHVPIAYIGTGPGRESMLVRKR